MKLSNPKNFYSGVMFVVFGLAFVVMVKYFDYAIGTSRAMGPGYVPIVLGGVLAALGAIIIFQSLASTGTRVSKFAWRPLIWVLGGFIIFGLTAIPFGLVVAIFLLVVISSYGGHEFKLKEALISSAILAAGSVAIFIYGLKLSFSIWPPFLVNFLTNFSS